MLLVINNTVAIQWLQIDSITIKANTGSTKTCNLPIAYKNYCIANVSLKGASNAWGGIVCRTNTSNNKAIIDLDYWNTDTSRTDYSEFVIIIISF